MNGALGCHGLFDNYNSERPKASDKKKEAFDKQVDSLLSLR